MRQDILTDFAGLSSAAPARPERADAALSPSLPAVPIPPPDVAEKHHQAVDPFPGRSDPGRPQRHHSLEAIQSDPDYSDGAKRVAARLDGYCLASGQFAAWPQMRRLANELGWSGAKDGGRKRVQRALAELIEGGDVVTFRVGAFVGWFDSSGGPAGLSWPKKLPRARPMLASVYILGWRVQAAATRDTDVPRWQDGQAPPSADVPPPGAPVSHGLGRPCPTPSLNVRTEFEEEEPTSDGRSSSAGPEEEASMTEVWTPRELAAREVHRLRDRGIILRAEGELIAFALLPSAEPPGDDDKARLGAMRAEVLAYLRGDPEPRKGAPGPDRAGYAPPADPALMAEFEAMAAILPRNTDPGTVRAAAAALGRALGDSKPESLDTWEGYAQAVRSGRMEASELIRAFRHACSPKARDRGRLMVNSVQRSKAMAGASGG